MKVRRTWVALGASLTFHAVIVFGLGLELRQPPRRPNPIEVALEGVAVSASQAGVLEPSSTPIPEMPRPASLPPVAVPAPARLALSTKSAPIPVPSDFDPDRAPPPPVVGSVPAPLTVPNGTTRDPDARGEERKVGESGDSSPLARYFNAIRARVDAAKRYPPLAQQLGQEGVVVVTFHLTPNGRLSGAPIVTQSSGFRQLDDAALLALKHGAPYPPFPLNPNKMKALQLPVKFELH
jgi:periplasmic protein TonB